MQPGEFADRADAARRLAARLSHLAAASPVVLAVPRGAVPMGRILADALRAPLDVVLVAKLRAPWQPELAVGAVDETGWSWIAPHARMAGADPDYLRMEAERRRAQLRERARLYRGGRPAEPLQGRTVIVVDDGLATGATMQAALHAVRAQQPARLVCAVPVASTQALALLAGHADEIVCLATPADFGSVGSYYRAFPQVEDAEVQACLAASPPPQP